MFAQRKQIRQSRDGVAALSLAPLLIAGTLLALSVFRVRPVRRGLARDLASRFGSIAQLRPAIVGRGRRSVEAILGPPRTIAARSMPAHTPSYLNADTWYYALNPRNQSIIAVVFRDDVVEDVGIFSGAGM